jgi:hypothetical protein
MHERCHSDQQCHPERREGSVFEYKRISPNVEMTQY